MIDRPCWRSSKLQMSQSTGMKVEVSVTYADTRHLHGCLLFGSLNLDL